MPTIDLIGSSPKFRAVLADVARIAPVDSAVLILGETGTGKEVIARAIHEASPRRNNRFAALKSLLSASNWPKIFCCSCRSTLPRASQPSGKPKNRK